MRTALFLAAAALAAPAIAQHAAPAPVSLSSKIFVAKRVTDAQGKTKNVLVSPDRVLPGDPLAVVLDYENRGTRPATAFVIDNPIPAAVTFTGVEQAWAVVSIDGGKSYGPLATLKVKKADGTLRAAIPQDVTHVRWKFAQPIAPGAKGKVTYFGLVK